jgi:transcriptional regulator of nitric oxide reductase
VTAARFAPLLLLLLTVPVAAQEGVFLSDAEAPAAVFPDADRFERREVPATPELQAAMAARLDGVTPSVWEERWTVVRAFHGERLLGQAVFVDEIGKHRPISFVVGLRPDGRVEDVAVTAYREAYGGEVRSARFLAQYHGKGPNDRLRTHDDVQNIAGATLSVDAASRAVRKAQALAAALAERGQ